MLHRQHRSLRRTRLLQWETGNLQRYVDAFEPPGNGGSRTVTLGHTQEFIIVHNLPLPDRCDPDFVDALIVVADYPATPPIGFYVLNTEENQAVVKSLAKTFNVFADNAYHEAPSLKGYTWICYHYSDNRWHFNANEPHKGDNVAKFMGSFFAECEART